LFQLLEFGKAVHKLTAAAVVPEKWQKIKKTIAGQQFKHMQSFETACKFNALWS
jgi:hypothetical protein